MGARFVITADDGTIGGSDDCREACESATRIAERMKESGRCGFVKIYDHVTQAEMQVDTDGGTYDEFSFMQAVENASKEKRIVSSGLRTFRDASSKGFGVSPLSAMLPLAALVAGVAPMMDPSRAQSMGGLLNYDAFEPLDRYTPEEPTSIPSIVDTGNGKPRRSKTDKKRAKQKQFKKR